MRRSPVSLAVRPSPLDTPRIRRQAQGSRWDRIHVRSSRTSSRRLRAPLGGSGSPLTASGAVGGRFWAFPGFLRDFQGHNALIPSPDGHGQLLFLQYFPKPLTPAPGARARSARQEQGLQIAQEIEAAFRRAHLREITLDQALALGCGQGLLDRAQGQAGAHLKVL